MILRTVDCSDSDNEEAIEFNLPSSRNRFLSLTDNDLFAEFTPLEPRKSKIQVIASPLNESGSPSMDFVDPFADSDPSPQIRRGSMRKSAIEMDEDAQNLLKRLKQLKSEMDRELQQFDEYEEVEHLQNEMQQKQKLKLETQSKLQQEQTQKKEQRESELQNLETERESELADIRAIISEEFSKRENGLKAKEMEIENMRKALESKMQRQHDLNSELTVKSKANDALIQSLKDKVSELLEQQTTISTMHREEDKDGQNATDDIPLDIQRDIERNKELIHEVEDEMQSVEKEQEEILKEIHDVLEMENHLKSEQQELDQEVMDLKDEHEDLEIEKEREIKKRSKNAFKKFDVRRANLMLESSIELKHIRERLTLLDTKGLMEEVKLKMMAQFKEQRMRLRLQLQRCKGQQLPFYTIPGSQFGARGMVKCAVSPNSEMVAAVGANGILQISDIRKNGELLFMKSLKTIVQQHNESDADTDVTVLDLQWDPDSVLLGLLLMDSKWIGIWNSVSKEFHELTVADCASDVTNISAFAWSNRKLLLGMANGDIHIKNTLHGEDGTLCSIQHKMEGPIDICRWSLDHRFAIIVQDTHIAVTTISGKTQERIASKQRVKEMHCGVVQHINVLSIVSSRNVIFHGIGDVAKRKLVVKLTVHSSRI